MTDVGKRKDHTLRHIAGPSMQPASVGGEEGEALVSLPPFIIIQEHHVELTNYLKVMIAESRTRLQKFFRMGTPEAKIRVYELTRTIKILERIQTIYGDAVSTAEGESTKQGGGVKPPTVDRISIGG